MQLKYTIIIPVYNRPEEIKELLETIVQQTFEGDFETLIIEDGSTITSQSIVSSFTDRINVHYLSKKNSGPGDSRNFGMRHAQGNYFIILDSDSLLPPHYLESVDEYLQQHYVDCFGGADAATDSFTDIQKAINYAMTSFLTTGGIRGNKHSVGKFEPRSFNMGISRKAFEVTGGFGRIHPGEDPDLSIRLWKAGFQTAFIEDAFVYHKRRISWEKYYKQVKKFGQTRAILNRWHKQSRKVVHWFPTLFVLGFLFSLVFLYFGEWEFIFCYLTYFILIFVHSKHINKSIHIGLLSVWAVCIQFFSYGIGFWGATLRLFFSKKAPELLFPQLFFNDNN